MGIKKIYTFAPAFSYQVNSNLSFLIQAEVNQTNRSTIAYHQNLQNTTYTNFNQLPVDFKWSLSGANIDASLQATNIFAQADYKISDNWFATVNLAVGENSINHSNQIYPQWTANNKFNRIIYNYGPRIFSSLNGQANVAGTFGHGPITNKLLAGTNFYVYRGTLRFTSVGKYDEVDLTAANAVPAPLNLERINSILASSPQTNSLTRNGSYSAYASDVVSFAERLHAMLSLRVDRYENQAPVTNGVKASAGTYNQTAFSPKVGLVYEVIKNNISLFGNYQNGYQNVAPVTQPASGSTPGRVDIFKPINANQLEGGVKAELFNKNLNVTFSYYNINIKNDLRVDNGITLQDSESKSKGFEAELLTIPVQGLSIVAGYASNSYKIIKASANVGKRQAQVPTDYANLWINYSIPSGTFKYFGVGLGGNYVSDCYFDAQNKIVIPHYTIANAALSYSAPKWALSVKMNNIGNKHYWTNYGIAEMTRQVLANLTFKF